MEIRILTPTDLPAALQLVRQVFQRFEAPEYPPQGVASFMDFVRDENIQTFQKNREMLLWGCFQGSTIVGVLGMRLPSHICLLFVAEEYHRQGIASGLMKEALGFCRKHSAPFVTVNSSRYALPAYRSWGFVPLSGEQMVDGIPFIPMELTL